jgi:hypothetical protein
VGWDKSKDIATFAGIEVNDMRKSLFKSYKKFENGGKIELTEYAF